MKIRKKATNVFKTAVEATPDIENCYQEGLRAFGGYSAKVALSSNCEGSVDIDACVVGKYPHDNRWDYVFGYKSKAYFVEVHSASSSEVSVVIRKLSWLKSWLNTNAPELNKIKADVPFYWIQSGKFDIPKTSRHHRLAVSHGIKPISRLILD